MVEGNETSVFFFLPTAMARRSLPAETSEKVGARTVRRGSERGARTRAGEVERSAISIGPQTMRALRSASFVHMGGREMTMSRLRGSLESVANQFDSERTKEAAESGRRSWRLRCK